MNWDAIGAVGEIVGAIAVVATLFYLARQTHQSVELEHSKEQRIVIDQFNVYAARMTDGENLTAIRKALQSYKTLDPDSQAIAWRIFAQWANFYEQICYSYEGGLVPKAIVDALEAWVLSILVTPGGSEYWEIHGSSHGIDIYEKVGKLLSDKNNLPKPITETVPWLNGNLD